MLLRSALPSRISPQPLRLLRSQQLRHGSSGQPSAHVGAPLRSTRPSQTGTVNPRADTNSKRAFYKDFGPPVFKVFLGALVTYQVLYWGWMKLESVDMHAEKTDELRRLEAEVREKAGK
ncbi:hypothetical protein K490DRAFT_68981 [Saccharata proteae CBS 121410]|uniref:Uncharacterized protein n=1 Tax=Saccharata proteae CBS 121410 TaxID=1314787 RepID=A0A9P4LVK5_9PEZI|nr:hypothetical protein K490DRAFT_68981 [Saccharata proteae CBS 121410]